MYSLNIRKSYYKDLNKLNDKDFDEIILKLELILKIMKNGRFEELKLYKAHKLKDTYRKGKFKLKNCWDLHIKNDIVLLYIIDDKNNTVDLIRIGSHSHLF